MTETELITEALGWLEDCFEDIPEGLTNDQIVRGIERHYDGGWMAFVKACA